LEVYASAPDRLPVQLSQIVHGGMEVPLALARDKAAHGEPAGALVLLHLAQDRLH
jgi:hypothetical protein